ncbi:ATP-binding protein [Thalassospira alkalitolerans]|uniref:ATPase AAA n=1 Tax=Thalassospira alkalitolerans TaxID=1293890 RepID=A0A1Y2L8H8_9PROT|nr:ATP-binding protein [Thalassospira alkalitolerans]OSQ45685.1 ATPase AAA [Thalassospira alkalitolerans]|tara:strand:+ start:11902 stop:12324 length:423 start_codon:yes stop_codon:yes gene_type:complete
MTIRSSQKPTLTLIRGLPGSGKSTLAETISTSNGACHLEADQFMIDRAGNYRFDGRKLRDAHSQCETECEKNLSLGQSVIVANTFSEIWEMQAYLDMAERHHVSLQIIECHGRFGNIHGVPDDKIDAMRKRWQSLPASLH